MEKKLCILLPAFNEGKNIHGVVKEIRAIPLPEVSLTILVVDDGSRDDTAKQAQQSGAIVISHPTNRGVGAAFRTGLEWIKNNHFDFMLHMDSDGQVPPEEIPKLFLPVFEGRVDLAIGSRFVDSFPANFSPWRARSLHFLSRLVSLLMGFHLNDISCGFRCMNRKVTETIRPHFDYDYIQESLIQALAGKARVQEIPVHIRYEKNEVSGMSRHALRYIRRFLVITGFSLMGFYWTRLKQLWS